MYYNESIEIISTTNIDVDLKKDEYFNYDESWIGLECTSDKKVYISKNKNKRENRNRGFVFIVKVKNINKCYIL